MTSVLCTNVRIIDSTGAQPYPGEVLVQGNRISRVGRGPRSLPTAGVTVIDGAGATLMPGLVEAHTHFSWNDAANLSDLQRLPLEEHATWKPVGPRVSARRAPCSRVATTASPSRPTARTRRIWSIS